MAFSIDDLSETRRLSERAKSDSRLDKRASWAVICSGEVIERGFNVAGVVGRVGKGVGKVDDNADMGVRCSVRCQPETRVDATEAAVAEAAIGARAW